MTTWDEPTDIHVEYEGKRYKLRRVNAGYRLWVWRGATSMATGCWMHVNEGKRHAVIVAMAREVDAIRDEMAERFG